MSDLLSMIRAFRDPEKGAVWRHKRTGMLVKVYRADASGVSVIRPDGDMIIYDPDAFRLNYEWEADSDGDV